jgi:hypothetical protein
MITPLTIASILSPPSTEIFFGWNMPPKSSCVVETQEGSEWVTLLEFRNNSNTLRGTGFSLDQTALVPFRVRLT